MKSFEIKFQPDGEVILNNISGVQNDECLTLTQPYTDNFGIIVERQMTNNFVHEIKDRLKDEKRI